MNKVMNEYNEVSGDYTSLMRMACGELYYYQEDFLNNIEKSSINYWCRQSGKDITAICAAIQLAYSKPYSKILFINDSHHRSSNCICNTHSFIQLLNSKLSAKIIVNEDSKCHITLGNGSIIRFTELNRVRDISDVSYIFMNELHEYDVNLVDRAIENKVVVHILTTMAHLVPKKIRQLDTFNESIVTWNCLRGRTIKWAKDTIESIGIKSFEEEFNCSMNKMIAPKSLDEFIDDVINS